MCTFTSEKSFNQLMEKIHKRKKYRKIYQKNEHIPKMHVFRDGVKELEIKDLEEINKRIIRKTKENKKDRKGSIDGLVVVEIVGERPVIILGYEKVTSNGPKRKARI